MEAKFCTVRRRSESYFLLVVERDICILWGGCMGCFGCFEVPSRIQNHASCILSES